LSLFLNKSLLNKYIFCKIYSVVCYWTIRLYSWQCVTINIYQVREICYLLKSKHFLRQVIICI